MVSFNHPSPPTGKSLYVLSVIEYTDPGTFCFISTGGCTVNKMTKAEIAAFIKSRAWGTLIGVEGDKPYAVEVSYGTDGTHLYCGTMPGGRMARCLHANPNVVFKLCTSDRSAESFTAVIIEGKAERLAAYEDILHSLRNVARHSGLDEHALDPIAKRHCQNPGSNFIRIPLRVVDGIVRAGGTFTARPE